MDRTEHRKRTMQGQARAAVLGRVPGRPLRVTDDEVREAMRLHPMGTTAGAKACGLSRAQYLTRRRRIEQNIKVIGNGQ